MDRESTVPRKVVPRWRPLLRTPSRELQNARGSNAIPIDERLISRFRMLYRIWRDHPTLENATEAIDSAHLVVDRQLAWGPAAMVLKDERTMPAVRSLANYIVNGPDEVPDQLFQGALDRAAVRADIRTMKRAIELDPRNALAWLEKCRLYTEIGDLKSGEKAALHAVSCAPENRFVLRGFCRFMVHRGKYEQAHGRLIRARSTRRDPWLQAAEISLAELSELSPIMVKQARESLSDGNLSAFHTSELAAALATLEAGSGKRRSSNRLFRRSLVDPTDNALSQVFWMRDQGNIAFSIDEKKVDMPGAAEARFLASAYKTNWPAAVDAIEEWRRDESFSFRAAANGSCIASSFLRQHDRAIRFCDFGLMANPGNTGLLNNKIVALCRSGKLDTASTLLHHLKSCKASDEGYVTALATLGLHSFRSGDISEGRRLYTESIRSAEKAHQKDAKFRALFHWAYEETIAGELSGEEIGKVMRSLDKMAGEIHPRRFTQELWSVTRKEIEERNSSIREVTSQSENILLDNIS